MSLKKLSLDNKFIYFHKPNQVYIQLHLITIVNLSNKQNEHIAYVTRFF